MIRGEGTGKGLEAKNKRGRIDRIQKVKSVDATLGDSTISNERRDT